jgi:pyruvate kinase
VKCKVANDCRIGERMVMTLPGSIIDLPTINDKDEADIVDFGLKNSVDMIAVSFVRSANCIETVRDVLGARGSYVKIIAKIQNQQGLNNYDEILAAADGVMIARSELSMEIPSEKVFIAQKWMIEKANIAAKPIIVATQMLESMCKSLKPSRTEASDVSCAVLDGTDAVLLGHETANGLNPISSVTMMAKICAEAERCIDYKQTFNDIRIYTTAPLGTAEAIASSSVSTVLDLNIDLVICVTDTGCISRLVSKYRPPVPILACSVVNSVIRNLQVVRGVWGFKIPAYQSSDNVVQMVVKVAKENHLVKSGGKVVVIQAQNEDTPDESNVMKIVDVE